MAHTVFHLCHALHTGNNILTIQTVPDKQSLPEIAIWWLQELMQSPKFAGVHNMAQLLR